MSLPAGGASHASPLGWALTLRPLGLGSPERRCGQGWATDGALQQLFTEALAFGLWS